VSEGEGGDRARTWTRQEGEGEGREREEEKVRDTATTKFRIATPNYLPMESTTHTSTPKNIFHSTQCIVSILTLQKLIQFLTEF
jgi:hypothetical protein